jgi:ABC-type branched-subunit amino acid transport system substrate-binding protein
MYPSGLIQSVEEYISAKELTIMNDCGWVATGSKLNQVVTQLE